MAFTNLLKKQVDLPVWEWMRFTPVVTGAGSGLCSIDDGSSRYLYYITGTTFWRYDTYSDGWTQCATPVTVPAVSVALKYSAYGGYRNKVISASSTTLVSGLLNRGVFDGMKIRIVYGTGSGQERTITTTGDPVIADAGFFSAVSGVATATDGLKKWKINQWVGYTCRTTFGTGLSQVRKIIGNDATVLYFYDVNRQQLDSWSNTGWSAQAPYAAPAAQTGYQIESTTLTVPTWDTTPDATSSFLILSGGIWLVSSQGTPAWSNLQYYDIAADVWYSKTSIAGNILAALGTDWSIDRTGEVGGAFAGPYTASAGAARTITIGTTPWTVDQYVNYQCRIATGTGKGQRRRIVGNTTSVLTVERNWDINPSTDSVFDIYADTDLIYLTGNATSSLFQYHIEQDIWTTASVWDWGTVRQASISVPGASGWPAAQEPIAGASITRVTTGIISGAINVAGTGYTIGDVVTCSTAGALGTFLVTAITTGGVVSGIELMASGSGYGAGSSATTGGTGSALTITLTVGTTGLVTCAINHGLKSGTAISMAGWATDTWWNTTHTILGVGTLTSFSLNGTGSAGNGTLTGSLAATTYIDVSKNWGVNEHTGRYLLGQAPGIAPAAATGLLISRITSNTSNTLTILTNNAPANGTWRYCIVDPCQLGAASIFKDAGGRTTGYATGGDATTITDTSQTWIPGRWVNFRVRIEAGTGTGNEAKITANTNQQLTVASWGVATPDTTSKYRIMDSFGLVTTGAAGSFTNTDMALPVNLLINKRCRITGGGVFATETTITANAATTITAAFGTTTTTSTYTVLETPVTGTNCSLQWIFGGTSNWKGKGLIRARGNCPQFDIYNITTEKWDLSTWITPGTESMVVGSMFAYDGEDRLYFTVGATGRVNALHLPTRTVRCTSLTPYAHGVGLAGNRMEMVITDDSLKYLYIIRHTGQEFWRSLIFWET